MKTIPSDEQLYDSRLIKMNKQTEICEFITMLTMLMVKWLKIDGGSFCLFYFGACLYFRATALICVRFAWETFKWNEWYKCIERTHSRTYAVYHMPFIPPFPLLYMHIEITAMKFIWVFNTKRKVHSCTTQRIIRNVSKSVCLYRKMYEIDRWQRYTNKKKCISTSCCGQTEVKKNTNQIHR